MIAPAFCPFPCRAYASWMRNYLSYAGEETYLVAYKEKGTLSNSLYIPAEVVNILHA